MEPGYSTIIFMKSQAFDMGASTVDGRVVKSMARRSIYPLEGRQC
jgi:hypothetical protein